MLVLCQTGALFIWHLSSGVLERIVSGPDATAMIQESARGVNQLMLGEGLQEKAQLGGYHQLLQVRRGRGGGGMASARRHGAKAEGADGRPSPRHCRFACNAWPLAVESASRSYLTKLSFWISCNAGAWGS